ncbi:putative transporter YutK [Haemaphysalis longicornis]
MACARLLCAALDYTPGHLQLKSGVSVDDIPHQVRVAGEQALAVVPGRPGGVDKTSEFIMDKEEAEEAARGKVEVLAKEVAPSESARVVPPERSPPVKSVKDPESAQWFEKDSSNEAARAPVPLSTEKTILEAGVCGTRVALRVLGNIVALVVSFMGCIKTCDLLVAGITDSIGLGSITLEKLIGYLMTPLALAMGVCLADSLEFGRLVGVKIVSNECIAFIMLQQGRKALEKRTVALATFALCGLGNLCSVGTALGTIGALCPQRLATVAQMSFRAMWAGCTATLLNACVVGSLID